MKKSCIVTSIAAAAVFMFCNSQSIVQAGEAAAEAPKADPPKTDTAAAKPADTKAVAPILHWKLDDGKGTSATDVAGKNNGNVAGEVAWVAEGKVGGALSLPDDKSCSVTVDSVSGLEAGNTKHTIAMWVKVSKLPANRAWVLLLGSEGAGSHHWLLNSAGETQFGVWEGGQVAPKLEVGKWVHVATTFDGTKLTGYVDGQKVGDVEATFNLQGVPLTVAKDHNGENCFDGTIDDVRIYASALSADEIAALAKAK